MSFSSLLLATTLLASSAHASVGPTADLTLTNGDISPDGFIRQAVLVNGQAPGPLIVANKGDEFNLNVIDKLTNDTMLTSSSIHWHGFFQPNNSWADGVASVTQVPHRNDQAGTFWYHSHLSTQYCDGLRGPLVVYDPNDPHASLYDLPDSLSETTVVTLADCTLGAIPPTSQLAVITVTKDKRYRMRLISMSCDPNFIFTIDGHVMTIIEADSVNTKPLTVDSIQIFAGQRYSFVLTADQDIGNYRIRTVANGGTKGFDNGINSAILRYVGADDMDPTTSATTSAKPLVETDLRPLVPTAVPGKPVSGGADVNLNLAITLDFTTFKFDINGQTFTPPTAPVLLQILSGAQSATDLLPAGSVFSLPPNSVVELSIPGGSPGAPHPFHLHGHNFFVVKSAGNDTFNFVDPVIRDVVTTGTSTSDNTTIRFVTNNAGPGLAIVFAEDIATTAKSVHPAEWDTLCPS
ncbi:laccase [Mycena filopes]|nr:laccase [Mycena filopes]